MLCKLLALCLGLRGPEQWKTSHAVDTLDPKPRLSTAKCERRTTRFSTKPSKHRHVSQSLSTTAGVSSSFKVSPGLGDPDLIDPVLSSDRCRRKSRPLQWHRLRCDEHALVIHRCRAAQTAALVDGLRHKRGIHFTPCRDTESVFLYATRNLASKNNVIKLFIVRWR